MSTKIYRSALGKSVDMGSLLSKNETVRAIGNMGVNARGDVVSNNNTAVASRNTKVNNHYRKQIQNQIVDEPVVPASSTSVLTEKEDTIEGLDVPLEVPNTESVELFQEEPAPTTNTPEKKGGLAAAIAKAREVEQKKLQTPREESRSKKGVKKI